MRLFERLARGIQMTDAGRRLVARAKRPLADADDLIAAVTAEPASVTGRLQLGITGHHASAAIAVLAGEYPEVVIETIHACEQALCPRLAQGRPRPRVLPAAWRAADAGAARQRGVRRAAATRLCEDCLLAHFGAVASPVAQPAEG